MAGSEARRDLRANAAELQVLQPDFANCYLARLRVVENGEDGLQNVRYRFLG